MGEPDDEMPGWSAESDSSYHASDSDDDSVKSHEALDAHTSDPPGDGERPRNSWRNRADPTTFEPLVQEVTTTILEYMPKLRVGTLRLDASGAGISVQCAVAGESLPTTYPADPEAEENGRRWKVWIEDGTEWNIPDYLTEQWKQWVSGEMKVPVKARIYKVALNGTVIGLIAEY
jgi:hypothetical protein